MSALPRPGDVLVLAGTKKGLFAFWSDASRQEWHRSHLLTGWQVHATAYDPRDGALYAAANSEVFGGVVRSTRDFGETWASENHGLDFGPDSEFRVRRVWQVALGEAPGTVYAGTERAGLFRSTDGGVQWTGVAGLNEHPHAPTWEPGNGGMCLHTVVPDATNPARMWIAMSTGGVYRTDDGGATWQARNQGIKAPYQADPFPEYGQCVHKVAWHPAAPDRLYAQNHGGVYRTDDGGDTWQDIGAGLSSDFGFPILVHPHDPDTLYVVPLVADVARYVPEGRMAVWQSRDRGASWQPLDQGLPTDAWLVILRDAMAADDCAVPGLYVGSNTGQLFHSRDEGATWATLADYLPPIYSVVAARVAG